MHVRNAVPSKATPPAIKAETERGGGEAAGIKMQTTPSSSITFHLGRMIFCCSHPAHGAT